MPRHAASLFLEHPVPGAGGRHRRTFVAESEGWPWTPPVQVTSHRGWLVGPRYWVVRTAAGMRGSSVRIEIDDDSQQVTLKRFIPR